MMKKHSLGLRLFSLLLTLALCLAALPLQVLAEETAAESTRDETDFYALAPVERGKATLPTPRTNHHGYEFAAGELADRLETIFYHGISGCVTPSLPAVGGSFSTSTEYTTTYAKHSGSSTDYQCQAYARAAYSYLFGCNQANTSCRVEFKDASARNSLSYALFSQYGVRCGAYIRTTPSSTGAYNGGSGHSLIVLGYDASGITTLEGNYNGSGGVGILTYSWDSFNQNQLSGRSRYVCVFTQPISSIYDSLGADKPPCASHVKGTYLWPELAHPHYNYFTCSVCGATFTDGTTTRLDSCSQCQAESHVHVKGNYLGYLDTHPHRSCFSCAECGATFSDASTSNFSPHCSVCHPSHAWNGGHVTDEPTFTQSGSRQYTCTVCGYQRNEFIPMLDSVTAQYSENIRMTYHRSGLLEIEGTGEVTAPSQGDGRIQFSLPGFEMKDYLDQVTRVQIGEGITALKGSVFGRMDNLEEIRLPDSLTYLERHNFYLSGGYPKLRTLRIPSGVSMIEGYWIPVNDHYSGNAFIECSGLAELTVDPANPYFTARDGVLYDKAAETLLVCPRAREGRVRIPGGVSKICWDAFSICAQLTGADIPGSVESIGYAAFYGCGALRDVYYGGTAEQWAAIAIGGDNEPLQNAVVHYAAGPSGNTMGPRNELTWARNGRTLTVTGPVSAASPLWAAAYDQNGRLLSVSPVTASGGSVSLPGGAASSRLIWTDGGRTPKCASVSVSMK